MIVFEFEQHLSRVPTSNTMFMMVGLQPKEISNAPAGDVYASLAWAILHSTSLPVIEMHFRLTTFKIGICSFAGLCSSSASFIQHASVYIFIPSMFYEFKDSFELRIIIFLVSKYQI